MNFLFKWVNLFETKFRRQQKHDNSKGFSENSEFEEKEFKIGHSNWSYVFFK